VCVMGGLCPGLAVYPKKGAPHREQTTPKDGTRTLADDRMSQARQRLAPVEAEAPLGEQSPRVLQSS
jgi:hypothetical protein